MKTLNIEFQGGTIGEQLALQDLAKFCIKKLLPRMRHLDIDIIIDHLQDDVCGFCYYVAEGRNDRPRMFVIEINQSQDLYSKLITLAHELVHVKQYARSELFENARTGKFRWKGVYLERFEVYNDSPWEVEAYELEEHLYNQWIYHTGYCYSTEEHI